MGELYYTNDVAKIMDAILMEKVSDAVRSEWLNDEEVLEEIKEIRILRKFADEIIAVMTERDQENIARNAQYERERKEASHDS